MKDYHNSRAAQDTYKDLYVLLLLLKTNPILINQFWNISEFQEKNGDGEYK